MATTTILCLFREPLPAGIVVSPTDGVANVRVEEDDRRVIEITVEQAKEGYWEQVKNKAKSFWANASGKVELVLPAGECSRLQPPVRAIETRTGLHCMRVARIPRAVNTERLYAVTPTTHIPSTPHVSACAVGPCLTVL